MKKIYIILLIIGFALGVVQPSIASLIQYEQGLVYDSTLDITWLQDSMYSKTIGDDNDGLMTWTQAMTWVDELDYLGLTEWRLPETVPGTDKFNQTESEMGHLYYVNLGNTDGYYGFQNPGPFINLEGYDDIDSAWWSSTQVEGEPNSAWLFNWFTGAQDGSYIGSLANVWAVHDGNVGEQLGIQPVPEPTTLFLIFTGLLNLLIFRKKLKLKS